MNANIRRENEGVEAKSTLYLKFICNIGCCNCCNASVDINMLKKMNII